MRTDRDGTHPIRTPDQRLRVFVSSTLGELAAERQAVRRAIERLRLIPVLFELGARPHPPRELYRAYLEQSDVFLGIYWERYGWVAPGQAVSGLEDEYRLAGGRPRLLYLKEPAPRREPRLLELIADLEVDDRASYKRFSAPEELAGLVEDDLAVLLSERFQGGIPAAPGPLDRTSGSVPTPLTPTIGRAGDVAEVVAALREGRRLVTLLGPGGVGKTRLAVEVARRLDAAFPDGIHFVPLSSFTDTDAALHAIADRLGARVESGSAMEAVVGRLAGARTLLVLDNLEQLEGTGPALVELLEGTPAVSVLATSRHALRVRGEWPYAVAPLEVPDDATDGTDAASVPAIALFVDRARASSPGFALTEDAVAVISEIVRLLDGLPLAIELAAAQLRVRSPQQVLDRVGDSLDAVTGVALDLPERQRALRATIEWSEDLLTESERTLFAQLSVFAGGWTLEAAQAVCGGGEAVPEVLAALLHKSLVVPDQEDRSATPRFRMLVPVHAHARDRLRERGEEEALERSHLAWVRALAERAQPGLCGPGQPEWVVAMAPERANLRAAVATAEELGEHAEVVELAWDVVVLYFVLDAVAEPESWLRRVVDARVPLDEVTDAKLRSLHALTRIHHGDYAGAGGALARALEVFSTHGMAFEEAVVLHQLGFVRFHVDGDVDGAMTALRRSSSLFGDIGHDWGVALAEAMLGSVQVATGDLDAAEEHHHRSLERARLIGSDQQEAQALGQLALVRLLQDRDDEALDLLTESAALLLRWHYRTDAAGALDALAVVAHRRGEHRTAAIAVCTAAAQRRALGVSPWPTLEPFVRRIHAEVRGDLGDDVFSDIASEAERGDAAETVRAVLNVLRRQSVPTG